VKVDAAAFVTAAGFGVTVAAPAAAALAAVACTAAAGTTATAVGDDDVNGDADGDPGSESGRDTKACALPRFSRDSDRARDTAAPPSTADALMWRECRPISRSRRLLLDDADAVLTGDAAALGGDDRPVSAMSMASSTSMERGSSPPASSPGIAPPLRSSDWTCCSRDCVRSLLTNLDGLSHCCFRVICAAKRHVRQFRT
jgi:hypothetical protein